MSMDRHFSLDVESNGPIIGQHSMISFGFSSVARPEFGFYAEIAPVSDEFIPEALAVSGFSHEQTKAFEKPEDVFRRFNEFLDSLGDGPIILWSDNPAYDYGWLNWYMHRFLGSNRLGHSCRSIGELYCGIVGSVRKRRNWKKFRQTAHTHNAFDDAKGNSQALRHIIQTHQIQI